MKRYDEIIDGVRCSASLFAPHQGGRSEIHAVLEPVDISGGISGQASRIYSVLKDILSNGVGAGFVPVIIRAFLSDVTNQASEVSALFGDLSAVLSVVGQPPVEKGVKISLLVIMVENATVRLRNNNSVVVERGAYRDIWSVIPPRPGKDSGEATASMLGSLESLLAAEKMSISANCLRTWFFVRDIDNRYMGMVKARNEFFANRGLTADTHFIASTGIEGTNPVPEAVVSLEAYSTAGLQPGQVSYISAPDHLNPTAQYGVAFERATAVDYGDRRMVIVSGTASINNRGEIVAPGNIEAQCARMSDNVKALLDCAGVESSDISHIVLYLRDIADSAIARDIVAERFPAVPLVTVNAAVCRPGWLVEMECMAIAEANNPCYEVY